MTHRRRLVAGNWKMNGLRASLAELEAVIAGGATNACDLVVCPPFTLVAAAAMQVGDSALAIGGQECHADPSGAHTGDVSAEMLADVGATYVIVGHSERRADHGETDATVRRKAEAAWRAGLRAIVCIGETGEERERGETETVLSSQIAGSVPGGATAENLVLAYEPVWAIGTGLTPTGDDIAAAHAHIRARLRERSGDVADLVRILYGGSVKPANAGEILAVDGVDGALVGGASLKATDFLAIATA